MGEWSERRKQTAGTYIPLLHVTRPVVACYVSDLNVVHPFWSSVQGVDPQHKTSSSRSEKKHSCGSKGLCIL